MLECTNEFCPECGDLIFTEKTLYAKVRYCGCDNPKPLLRKIVSNQKPKLNFEELRP